MAVAFSRSSRPIRPISFDRLMEAPLMQSFIIEAASCSNSELTGEKTEVIAKDRTPASPASSTMRCSPL